MDDALRAMSLSSQPGCLPAAPTATRYYLIHKSLQDEWKLARDYITTRGLCHCLAVETCADQVDDDAEGDEAYTY